ncbi:MAG: hypothetical protein WKF87_04345 [Chryseolinea sp.]
MNYKILACAVICIYATCTLFLSCEKKDIADPENSSFSLIQEKILTKSCALSGCHASENEYSYAEHGLVLRSGEAYENLLNVAPQNHDAQHDGLLRVVPGNPDKSLLYKKIFCNNDQPLTYGNPMPIGSEPLSQGKVQYIRQWIEEGAPQTGLIDADVSLLDDPISVCGEMFSALEAPLQGEGYQVHIEPFSVAPNFEREIFVYKPLQNGSEFFVNRVKMKMRGSSHHFLVNSFEASTPPQVMPELNTFREIRNADGSLVQKTLDQMEYHRFLFANQTPEMDYHFPEGVGLRIPKEYNVDVNLHYINKTSLPIQGECYINLYEMSPDQVQHEATSLFLSNSNIKLPAQQKTILRKTFVTDKDINIFMLTSHTHKYGEVFQVQIKGGSRDGEILFTSTSWHHPPIKTFEEPVLLRKGEGLTMIVTYNNTTNHAINFGLSSEDEMAIIYGYYY